jgi:hypothetical protein
VTSKVVAAQRATWLASTSHAIGDERAFVSNRPRVRTVPKSLEVDHLCEITLCERPDHLDLVTKGDNDRRRWQRARAREGSD